MPAHLPLITSSDIARLADDSVQEESPGAAQKVVVTRKTVVLQQTTVGGKYIFIQQVERTEVVLNSKKYNAPGCLQ